MRSTEPSLYLNDPVGLKEACLGGVPINNPEELLNASADFLCRKLINSDKTRLFFAQNLTTHLVQILSIVKKENDSFTKVYLSDHEIKWIKEMLEGSRYKLDATHSNYHGNEVISYPTFGVEVFPFNNPDKMIENNNEPAIFFISHVSRLTGEITNIASIFKLIKSKNSNSILIVDGAQSVGAIGPIKVEGACDVYLGVSSKFIGAEPHLGFVCLSESFFERYVKNRNNYSFFNVEKHKQDIYSLFSSLQNILFQSDYQAEIENLKKYAISKINSLDKNTLYLPPNQAPNFLTLNFGSLEKNKKFIEFASEQQIIVSDNIEWSIITPSVSLIRIGLSVRAKGKDIDRLIGVVDEYIKK